MTYELEERLYDLEERISTLPAPTGLIRKELLSIADAVGELEYRLDSLDR